MRDKAMLEEILVDLAQRVRTQSLNLAHAALGALEQMAAAKQPVQDLERLARLARETAELFAEFENLLRGVQRSAEGEAKEAEQARRLL